MRLLASLGFSFCCEREDKDQALTGDPGWKNPVQTLDLEGIQQDENHKSKTQQNKEPFPCMETTRKFNPLGTGFGLK